MEEIDPVLTTALTLLLAFISQQVNLNNHGDAFYNCIPTSHIGQYPYCWRQVGWPKRSCINQSLIIHATQVLQVSMHQILPLSSGLQAD